MKTQSELGLTNDTVLKYLRENRCAECGGTLQVESGTFYGVDEAIIRCIRSQEHSSFGRPIRTLTEHEEQIKIRRRLMQMENDQGQSMVVRGALGSGAMTQSRATEIIQSIWPDAPAIEVLKAAMLCADEGLNPLLNHVFLIPFKKWNKDKTQVIEVTWTRVIGIDGTREIIKRRGDYSYIDGTPRLARNDEQIRHHLAVDTKNYWAITKLQNVRSNAIVEGWGSWPVGVEPNGTDKGNTIVNMVCVRSERNALKKLPFGAVPEEAKNPVQVINNTLLTPDGRRVDQDGVIEGEVTELPDAQAPAQQQSPAPAPASTGPSAVGGETLGVCKVHGMPNINLRSKSNPKWRGVGHYIPPEAGGGICYKDKQDKLAADEVKKEFEQDSAQDLPPDLGKDTPAASPEGNEGKDDGGAESPDGKEIDSLAKQCWGPEWQPEFRNWLKEKFKYESRKNIKEQDKPKIILMLMDDIKKKQG